MILFIEKCSNRYIGHYTGYLVGSTKIFFLKKK